jgi:signal transduction histidine kinase
VISKGLPLSFFAPELIERQRWASGRHQAMCGPLEDTLYRVHLMPAADDRAMSGGCMPDGAPYGFRQAATQFLFGVIGLGLITFAAVRLNLQPGTVSLLYLIAVVFVSLRTGFVSSIAVSLVAVFCLSYFFRPLFSSLKEKNPLDIVATAAFLITAWVVTGMVARVRRLTETQLTLRFEERLAERARIARELHDTLLQSFQGLMLRFQAVNELLPPGKAKEALESVLDRADQAIVEGRDAIQDLRSSTTVTNELAQAISALGDELASDQDREGGSTTFRVSIEGRPRDLHPILRDDIYRIAREALRNAFRHAKASKIEAEIMYGERLLRLRIRDDGKGIDPQLLDAGRDGHWGLPGMRERAEQIGAKLDMWSEVGAGTEVELSIPGPVAYETSLGPGGFRLRRKSKEAPKEANG